jgi:F420-0:gamma-glutamyl ligase
MYLYLRVRASHLMQIEAVRTRILHPPKDDLLAVLDESLSALEERSIVVVSSKVVAIWQGRCVPVEKDVRAQKESLAKREAERYLERDDAFAYSRLFTVYEGVFGSVAGIDESNGDDFLVLLPKDAARAAADIRAHLTVRDGLAACGVVISDSRTMPMRNGALGVSLAHAGFQAVHDYRGSRDVFGRTLQFERANIADSIAAAAVLSMGEGDERTPLAVCTGVPHAAFGDETAEDPFLQASVPMDEDVFAQFFAPHPWKKGGA